MKSILTVFIFLSTIVASCQSRTQNVNSSFGKYYDVDEFGFSAPFAGEPNISTIIDNENLRSIEYRYAYPNVGDDFNYLYAVAVYQLKKPLFLKNDTSAVKFVASSFKLGIETTRTGQILVESPSSFNGKFCLNQKAKVTLPTNETIYVYSRYFIHHQNILRYYVFTPLKNEDNNRIEKFYSSVKLK